MKFTQKFLETCNYIYLNKDIMIRRYKYYKKKKIYLLKICKEINVCISSVDKHIKKLKKMNIITFKKEGLKKLIIVKDDLFFKCCNYLFTKMKEKKDIK